MDITCTTNQYTVGGTVSGLLGTGLVLQNNGTDDLPIGANGSFTFTTTVASSSIYAVTVSTSPKGPLENCTVSNDTGTVTGTTITNVAVTCSTTVTVPGMDRCEHLLHLGRQKVADRGGMGVCSALR